jgi:hypothetical protein
MIELKETIDYVYMLLVAAGVGAIGGFASELLLERARNTGTIELPGKLKDTRLFDIGFPASLVLGAVAAVAILYFFPPTTETVTPATETEKASTTVEYDLVKLVALALIVGSAGPRFLAAMQSRVLALLNAQKAETNRRTGKAEVERVAAAATAQAEVAVQKALAQQAPGSRGVVEGASAKATVDVAAEAARLLEAAMEREVKAAQNAIDQVAREDE